MAKLRVRKTLTGDYVAEQDSPLWSKIVGVLFFIIGAGVGLDIGGVFGFVVFLIITFGGVFCTGLLIGKMKMSRQNAKAEKEAGVMYNELKKANANMLDAYEKAGYVIGILELGDINISSVGTGQISAVAGPIPIPEGIEKITSIGLNEYNMNCDEMDAVTLINGRASEGPSGNVLETFRLKAYDVKPGDMISVKVTLPAGKGYIFSGKVAVYSLSKK